MKIVIAGGVISTFITIKSLVKHKLEIAGILGYEPDSIKNVSGYTKLDKIAKDNHIEYFPFKKINSALVHKQIKDWNPDLLFVVGLSQLVSEKILELPRLGTIGFHPTKLPRGRGRAPIAWLILEEEEGAANFFLMDEGTDSGPIFASQSFKVLSSDYASDIEKKIIISAELALDEWLPKLKNGEWDPVPQNENEATYFGKRTPLDGHIDWQNNSNDILKLIRASSTPHPGAFSFFNDKKLIIWKASLDEKINIKGVASKILLKDDSSRLLVQTGSGLIWLDKYELVDIEGNKFSTDELKIGSKLGYNIENEIYKIKNLLKYKEK